MNGFTQVLKNGSSDVLTKPCVIDYICLGEQVSQARRKSHSWHVEEPGHIAFLAGGFVICFEWPRTRFYHHPLKFNFSAGHQHGAAKQSGSDEGTLEEENARDAESNRVATDATEVEQRWEQLRRESFNPGLSGSPRNMKSFAAVTSDDSGLISLGSCNTFWERCGSALLLNGGLLAGASTTRGQRKTPVDKNKASGPPRYNPSKSWIPTSSHNIAKAFSNKKICSRWVKGQMLIISVLIHTVGKLCGGRHTIVGGAHTPVGGSFRWPDSISAF